MPNIFLKSDTSITASGSALKFKTPEVIVHFRPTSAYDGEFGFDWVRLGDTKLFGDFKFEDIVGKHYTDATKTALNTDGNSYAGHYAPSDAKLKPEFKSLKKAKYNPSNLSWKKKNSSGVEESVEYLMPWMSLFKKDVKAVLATIIDINHPGDYLQFEDSEFYSIEPKKIDIKGKSGAYEPKETLTITCLKEHSSDIELKINSYNEGNAKGVLAGKIKVWANEASKRKETKVVFVEVKTPELVPKQGVRTGDASKEKPRVNKYIKQALISLSADSDVVQLDLSSAKDFEQFKLSKKVCWEGTKDGLRLKTYMRDKLSSQHKKKYDDKKIFKAYYFAEGGCTDSGGGLNGFATGEQVFVFNSANDQTASHEFLHTFSLPHTFTNKETDSDAEYTYEYAKTENLLDYSHHVKNNGRSSLWYWQWVKANNSIK